MSGSIGAPLPPSARRQRLQGRGNVVVFQRRGVIDQTFINVDLVARHLVQVARDLRSGDDLLVQSKCCAAISRPAEVVLQRCLRRFRCVPA